MAGHQFFEKPDYNEEYRVCDFSTVISSLDTITAQTIVITDSDGADCTSDMISEVSLYVGSKAVRYKLKGGVKNTSYEMEIKITTNSNQKFVEPFTVCIT